MEFFGTDPRAIDVGGRLRELREERGMSLRALGRVSGLSTNALSMIERARTSPSVSTLYKIAEALNVPITAFFRLEPPKQDVVFLKASQRSRVSFPRGLWEGLGGEIFRGGMEPLLLTLEQGANSGQFPMLHSGDEFVLCLGGRLEYEVEGHRYNLDPGDSLIFAAQLQHRWRNMNKGVTRVIIVLSGFAKDEHPSEYHLSSSENGVSEAIDFLESE
ncbi:MAG: helix-turn-helix domain-containing protein [Chloroflexi bacterium]|nr:helix-turn-helix domain-containing protein [Chloroflexota bacterium]